MPKYEIREGYTVVLPGNQRAQYPEVVTLTEEQAEEQQWKLIPVKSSRQLAKEAAQAAEEAAPAVEEKEAAPVVEEKEVKPSRLRNRAIAPDTTK